MNKIHNVTARMPAILPKDLNRDWLQATAVDDPLQKASSLELLKPYDDDLLTWKPVYNIKKRDAFGNAPETLKAYDYSREEGFNLVE